MENVTSVNLRNFPVVLHEKVKRQAEMYGLKVLGFYVKAVEAYFEYLEFSGEGEPSKTSTEKTSHHGAKYEASEGTATDTKTAGSESASKDRPGTSKSSVEIPEGATLVPGKKCSICGSPIEEVLHPDTRARRWKCTGKPTHFHTPEEKPKP